MWNKEPSSSDIAKWFGGFDLHEGLNHQRYISGVVAIKENNRMVWKPYVGASTRVLYFWDYLQQSDLCGEINVTPPGTINIEFKVGDESKDAVLWSQEATVIIKDKSGNVIRKASAKKNVKRVVQLRSGAVFPDLDGIAKAETGAIARALGLAGILAFPGSGIATAEDMNDFLASQDDALDKATSLPAEKAPSKRAPNPKNA